jgi:hypothetical protein
MKPSDLQAKLIRAAQNEPPQDQVPYAFEKRIMTRIGLVSPLNFWALWGRPLWQGALSCVAITLLCGLWSLASAPSRDSTGGDNFAQDFDGTVLASLNQHVEDAW